MIKKIASLKGHIDCPFCLSYLEWNDIDDIHVFNGNKYVTCPQCNKNILLDDKKDYWDTSGGVLPDITEEDNGKILKVVNGTWSKVDSSEEEEEEEKITLFEGEVVTSVAPEAPISMGTFITESMIDTDSIFISFDGQTYELPAFARDEDDYGGNILYGLVSSEEEPDFSQCPFAVQTTYSKENGEIINFQEILFTEQPGTYPIKIEAYEAETPADIELPYATITIASEITSDCACAIPIINDNEELDTYYNIMGYSSNNVLKVPLYNGQAIGHILRSNDGEDAVNVFISHSENAPSLNTSPVQIGYDSSNHNYILTITDSLPDGYKICIKSNPQAS